jgi:DNA-binding beta-propeller fold protein YncE
VEPVAVSKAVTGLQPETLYHYRIAATNAEGTSYGKDQTFLTTPVYSHLSTIGSPGTGNGQFKRPLGMDTDSSGNVWVVDRENNRLQKFNSEGEYLTQIGTKGSALGQFNDPRGVAIDAEGNLWVTEAGNQRIQKLSPGGPGLLQIKESLLGNPWLSTPSGITIGGDGNIYITDQGKQNVQKYSPTPDQFGNRHLISWSGYLNPTQMATDPQGDVWFVEFQEAGVYEVGSNYLVPEKRFGTKGSGIGQLLEPYGIAIKPSGNILITERGNNRVEQFSPSGGYLTQFGSKGTGVGQFTEPTGITVTQGGAIFVSDAGNNRIQLWEPK